MNESCRCGWPLKIWKLLLQQLPWASTKVVSAIKVVVVAGDASRSVRVVKRKEGVAREAGKEVRRCVLAFMRRWCRNRTNI